MVSVPFSLPGALPSANGASSFFPFLHLLQARVGLALGQDAKTDTISSSEKPSKHVPAAGPAWAAASPPAARVPACSAKVVAPVSNSLRAGDSNLSPRPMVSRQNATERRMSDTFRSRLTAQDQLLISLSTTSLSDRRARTFVSWSCSVP
jgi:hypothetical protein